MRQSKSHLGYILLVSILLSYIVYYHLYYGMSPIKHAIATANRINKENEVARAIHYRTMQHVPLDEVYKTFNDNDTDDYSFERDEYAKAQMLITQTCKIPLMMNRYEKKHPNKNKVECGKRAVFLNKVSDDHVRVMIKDQILQNHLGDNTHYDCCVRFLKTVDELNKQEYSFTSCEKFEDGHTFKLESDFINVRCNSYNNENETLVIYDDVYAFTKKVKKTKAYYENCESKYNVLMLGMDSMSLSRVVQTMSRTVSFLKNNYWLGFRGFHKIGENKFDNLIATLTGVDSESVTEKCSNQMDSCNNLMIWKTFQEAGYVTAYGEDYLALPDTFSINFTFTRPPTDHYMKPFFAAAERDAHHKRLLCTGKIPSGQQLLEYALDFVTTYRNESFFGYFWMNSFSHSPEHQPENADKLFENFFNRLFYTGTLSNTFVIFFSDHGIRFGPYRDSVEGYYDDRMPFLFIWPPSSFKVKYPESYKAMAVNQYRLMTHYDLYKTLLQVHKLSCNIPNNNISIVAKGSFKHQSILKVISENRSCSDVNVDEQLCSCHNLYPFDEHDTEGLKVVPVLVSYLSNMTSTIPTKHCTKCLNLELGSISRIHFYHDKNNDHVYYVVAIKMLPANITYEATIVSNESKFQIVGQVNLISEYNGLGTCTINHNDRIFCVCQDDCNKTFPNKI
ncbi:uncharacterized protein LOC126966489 [Leptidea sinapis]|uniref:uncharacterized protein LOC126966489 n=1 Tax=Leptidea sinapis TaxID=189913 RepID=UPI00212AD567|nr:uncharacterized protein LOC126966489 [Leptidea sinapis]